MSKKQQMPLLLRVVRWWFPRLERYAQPLATRLFTQLFFTPLHYGFPEKEQEWVQRATRIPLVVNGKSVAVYAWGDVGHPLVLFAHGWAGRGTQFRKFFQPFLVAGFRVVAFDGPAHGHSAGRRTNILEFAEVMKKLIAAVGEPHAVVAHSFGGVVSIYSNTLGLPIKKLINIGSPVIGDKIIQTFLNAVNGQWRTGEKFKAYMKRKYNRSFDEFSAQYLIHHLKTPINLMLVHDAQDKDVSIDHAERLAELYPAAFLYRTSGLGHNRILKDDVVIKDCLKFVQDA
jgi:predicted alpha/beta hydrolase family esterase